MFPISCSLKIGNKEFANLETQQFKVKTKNKF